LTSAPPSIAFELGLGLGLGFGFGVEFELFGAELGFGVGVDLLDELGVEVGLGVLGGLAGTICTTK
jgi:hypothetical protein